MPYPAGPRSLTLAVLGIGVTVANSYPLAGHTLPASPSRPATAVVVDTAHSVVRWRGTKFGGRSAHAGVVRVRSGTLDYDAQRAVLRGGVIEMDMRSIAVTDMPLAEQTARGRLLRHLLAEDFFDVAHFPVARFTINRVSARGGNLLRLDGLLTLRGITLPFGLEATVWSFEPTQLQATARASIDRMRWGVAFRGSRLTNDLVDDEIQLEVDIVARSTDTGRIP
jgi:polyisoprenoid-binding protein YceI